ncbi:hypothetical protein AWJ20_2702 [Sugiyamaella lignohabitans]|uniref:DUF1868 domain-containing protein n=1 Tax=Sugiyamaella lignohabitans TaxID=796027 RepID=A0A167FBR6_9ASCO|nr:uncharacterized protein AWJ20_2702 [Sugiyamaella lignohabitans]ANB15082.1 hypothetical protein AWJ20_2702 [Sugiyamaella lignohabitans]
MFDVVPDSYLADILFHNRVDDRCGITVITQPPSHVIEAICLIQKRLSQVIDSQRLWLTPSENLHLTLLELIYNCSQAQVEEVLLQLNERHSLQELLSYIVSVSPVLHAPKLKLTPSAIILIFSSKDKPIPLSQYKLLLRDKVQIDLSGYSVPRYSTTTETGHITLARFIAQIKSSDVQQLESLVSGINDTLRDLVWHANNEVNVRSGPVWYGGGHRELAAANGIRN